MELQPCTSCFVAFSLMTLLAVPVSASEFGPEAKREFSVQRKNVFEFTQKPALTRKGDRIDIRFSVKDYCDVSIAIENSHGLIVRHLACGILGPNAPEPFKKNSLEQHVIWNGKDDRGKYIDDKDSHSVRVSLGLKAQFERNLYHHPLRALGNDSAIAADKDGVYIYSNNYCDYVRKFDHDGNYANTLYPFSRSKLKDIKGLPLRVIPPDGDRIPDKKQATGESQATVSLLPFETPLYKVGNYPMGGMAVQNGNLSLLGTRMARLATDGTSGGRELYGPKCRVAFGKSGNFPPYCAAASPDGKWIYATRVFYKADKWVLRSTNGVYRIPSNGPQNIKLFIGTQAKGKTDETFGLSHSVSTDRKGRIYVADWSNDRIQVFDPAGKFLRKFSVVGPAEVHVDPQSDEIWVFSWQVLTQFVHMATKAKNLAYNNRVKRLLRVFAPLDSVKSGAPKLKVETSLDVAVGPKQGRRNQVPRISLKGLYDRAVVDFWSNPKRVWIVTGRRSSQDSIYALDLKDGKLSLHRNFDADVTKAGYRQYVTGFQRQFLAFDPVNEHLYLGETDCGELKVFSSVIRIDVNTGQHKLIRLPAGSPDLAIDQSGMAYLRLSDTIVRYKLPEWREVPYDYGEELSVAASATSHGTKANALLRTPGGQGGSDRYNSIGVSPLGNVIATCNWKTKASRNGNGPKRWAPQLYPGRPSGPYVHVYDQHGQVKHQDVLKGIGLMTGGIDADLQGNIYAVVRANRILDGKGFGLWPTSTLMKFKPGKGRFLTANKPMVALAEKPKRKPESGRGWVEGAEWAYGWASSGSTNHCWCRHAQFKVDYFGRSFVPESDRFSIAVLDTNGQLIMRVGRCGNVDDGKPLIASTNGAVHRSIGGDEVALFDAHYVNTQTDKRLFIGDIGNGRVMSVKLDYHVNERVALKNIKDEKKAKDAK